MLNITKTVEYALIALRHINNANGKVHTSKEIALLYNINELDLFKKYLGIDIFWTNSSSNACDFLDQIIFKTM